MTYDEYEPTRNNPQVAEFLNKFGGCFPIHAVTDVIYYEDEDHEWYKTPEAKQQFLK